MIITLRKKNRTDLEHHALFSSWKALSNESSLDPSCNLRFFRPLPLHLQGVLKWVFLVLNDRFYDAICISVNFNPLSRTVQKLFKCPGTFSLPCIYRVIEKYRTPLISSVRMHFGENVQ